ncbi:hypothetical protein [Bombiscardovia coagulans]|uniref:Uncharacterized protein n=1 Tax=Bombiscardovia coagulans TaxID=686666 RepID=A0A261ESN5_9BIFI|nr:hypothetical protein [Bombiscardovia coagulans]OZG49869.1 hypothetical protein BOCO_0386 [Bombiscardovia coagulans]
MSNTSRKPKHSPGGTGGQYDYKSHDISDLPVLNNPKSKRNRISLYNELDSHDKQWRWLASNLRATQPGLSADYRDQPVCTPEQEMALVEQALGSNDQPGPLVRELNKFLLNVSDAQREAERYLFERLAGLRQAIAIDPTRCYSPQLVASAVKAPVKIQRVLRLPPWNLTEHKMRVGLRYQQRVQQWQIDHHTRGLPPSHIRDQLWDENMMEFINDKIVRGVSFGGGMRLSDGRNANPHTKRPDSVKRLPDGRVYNGRKDFEVMFKRGQQVLRGERVNDLLSAGVEQKVEVQEDIPSIGVEPSAEAKLDLQALFNEVFAKDLDRKKVAKSLHLNPKMVEQWHNEWMMQNSDA